MDVSCSSCGFPIAVKHIGQAVACPFCQTIGIAVQEEEDMYSNRVRGTGIADGLTIPSWLVAGITGFTVAAIFWPTIMASTEAGSRKLAELTSKRIGRIGR